MMQFFQNDEIKEAQDYKNIHLPKFLKRDVCYVAVHAKIVAHIGSANLFY